MNHINQENRSIRRAGFDWKIWNNTVVFRKSNTKMFALLIQYQMDATF